MLEEHWDELVAQVEDHGSARVKLYLADSGPNGEDLELVIEDIRWNNEAIEVLLR